ncbi:MAG: guanylate kinase [Bacteroidales bacterium]|jgi:guanylate kinase
MEGKIVIISAPSGAGKTTIVNYLLEQGLGLEFSISATTREPRGNEKNGTDYYFISKEDFMEKISKGEFVEWEEVYSNQFYGTLNNEMERIWSNNKHVLFDVDVKGGLNLKRIFGTRAISIFIMPPSVEELEKRLILRGTDNSSRIKIRVSKAIEEIKLSSDFDIIVINDFLDRAQQEVIAAVRSFLSGNINK